MRIIRLKPTKIFAWLCSGMICLTATGCVSVNSQSPTLQPSAPTPTIASFFQSTTPQPSTVPSLAVTPESKDSPVPNVPAPTRSTDQVAAISLYDETLNTDWSAEQSSKTKYDLASTAFAHSGKKAIMITPTADFGQFFLTVRKGAQKIYPRDRILGISFWLNGGENSIGTSDLAVAVIGSNQYTYWAADDTSVKIDTPVTPESPLFPETRLYYLHINRTIPPNTWVEVVLWLDDQVDEPVYSNITGMYIKNDKEVLTTYYIDDIRLLIQR